MTKIITAGIDKDKKERMNIFVEDTKNRYSNMNNHKKGRVNICIEETENGQMYNILEGPVQYGHKVE